MLPTNAAATAPEPDQVALASRAATGDSGAQRALVGLLLNHVRRTVGALLRGDRDAEDAMQLAMIEILRSAGTYRGEASIHRWAGRIAARTALRMVRERREREEDPGEPFADGEEQATAEPAEGGDATTFLASLSLERRTCLVLRHIHGYTVEEIAELTQTSPNTVKDRLLSARAELRKLVRREHVVRAAASSARQEGRGR